MLRSKIIDPPCSCPAMSASMLLLLYTLPPSSVGRCFHSSRISWEHKNEQTWVAYNLVNCRWAPGRIAIFRSCKVRHGEREAFVIIHSLSRRPWYFPYCSIKLYFANKYTQRLPCLLAFDSESNQIYLKWGKFCHFTVSLLPPRAYWKAFAIETHTYARYTHTQTNTLIQRIANKICFVLLSRGMCLAMNEINAIAQLCIN